MHTCFDVGFPARLPIPEVLKHTVLAKAKEPWQVHSGATVSLTIKISIISIIIIVMVIMVIIYHHDHHDHHDHHNLTISYSFSFQFWSSFSPAENTDSWNCLGIHGPPGMVPKDDPLLSERRVLREHPASGRRTGFGWSLLVFAILNFAKVSSSDHAFVE